jgi:hypothetical protein
VNNTATAVKELMVVLMRGNITEPHAVCRGVLTGQPDKPTMPAAMLIARHTAFKKDSLWAACIARCIAAM